MSERRSEHQSSNWSHPFLADPGRPLILASQSPRRADILRAQGLAFATEPAHVDESALANEAPAPHVRRLALEKARTIARKAPRALVLGCDTVVVIDGEILGKPRDAAEARAMLARLSGRTHVVYSSAALVCHELDRETVSHDTTDVRFGALTESAIAAYVQTGEPLDKAGAYGIQELGAMMVASIEGCYFNVMGLPLQALRRAWDELLGAAGKESR